MARLVLTAENYAFGPIGKLLYVTDLLKNKGHKLTFAGYGTSLQLAKKFPFDEIFEIDTDDSKYNSQLKTIISKSDALISSMDVASIKIAKQLKKTTIWMDCLFWFWDTIPEDIFNVDLYLRERSLDDSVNEAKYAGKIKNLKAVGPIIGNINQAVERKNQAMISFGGGEASHYYKVGKDTNYPFVITDILSKTVDWSRFDRILLATSEKIILELKKRFPNTSCDFGSLADDKFLEEVSRSKILLTTPGLITAQGSYYLETPTLFIPASNDSQYLQLEQLRRLKLADATVGLDSFMPKLDLMHIPVEKSTKLMLDQLRDFENSPEIQTKVGIKINGLVKNCNVWSKESVRKGKDFINSLGGNGVQAAADEIEKILN